MSKRLAWLVAIAAALLAAAALAVASPEAAVPAAPAQDGFLHGQTVRLLVVGDPFSIALRAGVQELSRRAGGHIELEVVGYDDVRRLTLLNALDKQSAYDIVSFDSVWAGEYGVAGILQPLDEWIAASAASVRPDDFLEVAYAQARYKGRQLGLPIQPHPELLWLRRDLFERAGLAVPATTDELLAAARRFTKPAQGQYGLCWNGQRGQALGQQMAHFYAAFGQPLLDARGRPSLNTARGIAAARFAKSLLPYSPPDVLNMAWDQRPARFAQGGCVMTYEWAARSYLVEEDPSSQVAGLVAYEAAPHAPGVEPVTSIGTWSLGIPANIGARRDIAWPFLAWLTSSEIERWLAQHGNGGMPRYSVMRDAALAKRYPAFATVARLGQSGQLSDWMRPAVPQWSALCDVLGTVYHDMLRGELSPQQAAERAQRQADALFAATTAR
jgi:multiple sugar transport system substrate-binding protein